MTRTLAFCFLSLILLPVSSLRGEVERVADLGEFSVENAEGDPSETTVSVASLHERLRKLEKGWHDETENVIHLQRETGRQLELMDQQDRRQNRILIGVSGFFLLLAVVEHVMAYRYLKWIHREMALPRPPNCES